MSVAVGIAQPLVSPPPPRLTARYRPAGTATPPSAAAIGSGQARVAKVAGDELALEFQAGDEEEDRQQPVR